MNRRNVNKWLTKILIYAFFTCVGLYLLQKINAQFTGAFFVSVFLLFSISLGWGCSTFECLVYKDE